MTHTWQGRKFEVLFLGPVISMVCVAKLDNEVYNIFDVTSIVVCTLKVTVKGW